MMKVAPSSSFLTTLIVPLLRVPPLRVREGDGGSKEGGAQSHTSHILTQNKTYFINTYVFKTDILYYHNGALIKSIVQ